jgi:hypothetical protein
MNGHSRLITGNHIYSHRLTYSAPYSKHYGGKNSAFRRRHYHTKHTSRFACSKRKCGFKIMCRNRAD